MNPYKGKGFDLGEDAIRLVLLHKGLKHAPIECTLVVTRYLGSLQGIPYKALSYTWSDESDTAPVAQPATTLISLDGAEFQVTKNLASALAHLRDPCQDKLLWVDAICINQAHTQEKTHQVKRMQQIYKSAERVIIWLGPGNENTDLLMDTAQQLDQRAGIRKCWNHEWELMKQTEPLCRDEELGKRVAGLKDLLGRSWFQRVWIIQEAASNNRATITCGSKSVYSRTFSLLPQLMHLHDSLDNQTKSVLEVMPGTLRKTSWWQRDRSLAKLLLKFGHCKASVDRDRFYALFGLADDFNYNTILEPDYDMPDEQVIQNLTWALLFRERLEADIRLPEWDQVTFLEAIKDLPTAFFQWALSFSEHLVLQKLFLSWGQGSEGIVGRSHGGILHRMLPLHSLIRANSSATLGSISTFLRLATADLVNAKDKDGDCPLHLAIKQNNLSVLQLLLKRRDIKVNARDKDGDCPLHLAIKQNNLSFLQLLLQRRDIKVNAGNLAGDSPLVTAVLRHHVEAVNLLLQHRDIDVNFKRPKRLTRPTRTSLMEAASRGHSEIVGALINHPYIDINLQAEDRATSLNLAVERGHTSVVELLLQHPGFIAKESKTESSLETPVNLAITTRGHRAVSEGPMHNRLIDVNCRGAFGDTPLHTAVKEQRSEIVQLLLNSSDINVNCCNDAGDPPLHIAVWMDRKPEMDLLLQHDAIDVNYVGKRTDSRTALWWAVHRNKQKALNTLLQRKDIRVHHTSGNTPAPLQLAARNGDVHLVERLISKATEYDQITRHDIVGAALVQAVYFLHTPLVKVLLEIASETRTLDKVINTEYRLVSRLSGLTYDEPISPLHAAIGTSSDLDIIRLLLSKGGDANKVNHERLTPLWRAICLPRGNIGLIKLLLECGANPKKSVKTIPTGIFLTPAASTTHLYLAASKQLPGICELLLLYGADANTTGSSGISPLVAVLDFQHSRISCLVHAHNGHEVTMELVMDGKFVEFMSHSASAISYPGAGTLRVTINSTKEIQNSKQTNDSIFKVFPFASGQSSSTMACRNVQTLDITLPTDEHEARCRDTAEVLLRNGANIEASNDQGLTPLWMAVCQNNIGLVKLLLQHGANVDVSDTEHRRTPLCVAALLDSGELVELLLGKGADPQIECRAGKTPLSVAAEKGCVHAVKALLQNSEISGNIHSVAKARDIARDYGHTNLAMLINSEMSMLDWPGNGVR